jgi:hypothetical protein
MNTDKLAKMANQIAANCDYGADKDRVPTVVADHLTRFWTPAMRAAMIDGHDKNLVDLSPVAARAVEKLVKPPSDA